MALGTAAWKTSRKQKTELFFKGQAHINIGMKFGSVRGEFSFTPKPFPQLTVQGLDTEPINRIP